MTDTSLSFTCARVKMTRKTITRKDAKFVTYAWHTFWKNFNQINSICTDYLISFKYLAKSFLNPKKYSIM